MINVAQYREKAKAILPAPLFNQFDGAVEDETTLAENLAGMQRVKLIQRVLRDVRDVSTKTTVLGTDISVPVLLAPAGHHGDIHAEGETATARAAAKAGTIMIVSNASSCSLEEVGASSGGPLWAQTFFLKDRGINEDIVRRAEAAGFKAIVVTVDTQVVGNAQRNTPAEKAQINATRREGTLEKYNAQGKFDQYFDLGASWSSVEWLRKVTTLPIVVKGLQTVEDARHALDAGADLLYVSNHGGRQLDGSLSSIELLKPIVEAVDGKRDVLVDGGFRRGTDILKALAIGAKAAVIGRPYLYGLAAGGEAGVTAVLEILKSEIVRNLKMMGCASVDELDRSWLRFTPSFASS
jgi:4-hydroxymandelate oxidase